MASLKEVKGRIASVNNTRKITSAMKMVASAKLHKAQAAIENMLRYERRLNHILTNFLSADSEVESPFIVKREVKRVAIVVFASNTSLCGGFNANIIRHLTVILDEYKSLGMENVLLYPVGRKVAEGVKKLGFKAEGDFQHMADKPSYQEAAALAEDLMRRFLHRDIDKVELLYNHFRSTAVQVLTRASEHAARTMAMQIATDNANDLLQDLTVMYNKSRQQAITNELLDIVGGSMA